MSSGQSARRIIQFHTGPILVGKIIQYLGVLLVAFFIPRIMGPTTYGSYAVYVSFLIFLSVLGDLGTLAIYGRYVPGFKVTGEDPKINILFTQLVFAKGFVAVLIGILCVVAGQIILPDWPVTWLVIGAATLILRIVADNSYHIAFGLNYMGRWIARESLRSLVQFILVLILFTYFSLLGAVVAIFLADLVFFIFGFSWARHYFARGFGRLSDLQTYLRYGSGFYIATICMMGFMRGGDILLAAGQVATVEIAYFDLAFTVFITIFATIAQLVQSATPTLSRWWMQNRQQDVNVVINILWKGSVAAAVIIIGLVWLTADFLIPLFFGEAYSPVSTYLKLLVLALIPLAVGQMSFIVAAVYERPKLRLWASLVTFVVFVIVSIALIPYYGALGTVIASMVAMVAYAIVTYLMSRPILHVGGWRSEITFLVSRF